MIFKGSNWLWICSQNQEQLFLIGSIIHLEVLLKVTPPPCFRFSRRFCIPTVISGDVGPEIITWDPLFTTLFMRILVLSYNTVLLINYGIFFKFFLVKVGIISKHKYTNLKMKWSVQGYFCSGIFLFKNNCGASENNSWDSRNKLLVPYIRKI